MSNSVEIKLDGIKFDILLKALKIMGASCDYFIIKNSVVREVSTNKSNIFEIDLSKIFERDDVNLTIPFPKQKVDMLSVFKKQKTQPIIRYVPDSNQGCQIEDDLSIIKIPAVMETCSQSNEYITQETLVKYTGSSPENMIIGSKVCPVTINSAIVERYGTFSKALESKQLLFIFENNKVINRITIGEGNSSTYVDVTTFDIDEERNHLFQPGCCRYRMEPILMCDAPLQFESYYVNKRRLCSKFTTTLSDELNVTMDVWCMAVFESYQ